jgi:hypothetical protein
MTPNREAAATPPWPQAWSCTRADARGRRNLTGNAPAAAARTVDNLGMDKNEAGRLLEVQLEEWRRRPYAELSREVGRWRRFETTGQSGERYEGVIQVFWLGDADGPVKVVGSIDDGGWRTFVPLSKDFTVTPKQAMPSE